MPTRDLPIEDDAPARLHIDWKPGWKGLHATLGGREIAVFASKDELLAGRQIALDDESTLSIRLLPSVVTFPSLEILRDGFPVPGSDTHPAIRIRGAAKALFVLAGLSVLSAFLQFRAVAPAKIGLLIEAVLFAVFGAFTWRLARWALISGIALYALESVFVLLTLGITFFQSPAAALGSLVGFVLWRAIFFTFLGRGFVASRELDRRDPSAIVAVFR